MEKLRTTQYLTFSLGGEIYALEVSCTREVVPYVGITPLPQTPEWIRGVINLRGSVIPVLDIKLKLGIGLTERTKQACILILEVVVDGEITVVGMLADGMREVLDVDLSEIEPPPRFGTRLSTSFIRGMGRRDEGLFIILDIEKVFRGKELELLQGVAEEAEGEAGVNTDRDEESQGDGGNAAMPTA